MLELIELQQKILNVLQENIHVLNNHQEILSNEAKKLKYDKIYSSRSFQKTRLIRKFVLENIRTLAQACLNIAVDAAFVFKLLQSLLEPPVVSNSISVEAFIILITTTFDKLMESEKFRKHLLHPLLINFQTILKYSAYPMAVKKNGEKLIEWCNRSNFRMGGFEIEEKPLAVCSQQKLTELRKSHMATFLSQ